MDNGQEPSTLCKRLSDEGSGLFVDVENLHTDAQKLIQSLVCSWPNKAPKLTSLNLYVKADQSELWRLWAESTFSDVKVFVRGTQHFSMTSTKNSADIAIATNAIADLIFKRISYVVVFSDDSDFISLYATIRDDPDIDLSGKQVPFLWVVTDRPGTLSKTIKQFFPQDQLHVMPGASDDTPNNTSKVSGSAWDEMAKQIVKEIPTGTFKSTDCQPLIKKMWPKHPMSRVARTQFGTDFKNNVWPLLESWGVKMKSGSPPVQYEMTEEAKASHG